MMKVLILGVNGFIGNSLVKRILDETDWEVFGMDLASDKLDHSLGNKRLHFIEGDISISKEWIEYHVKKCDVVLPLVAIATPAAYVKEPIEVFELDFEENLRVVRQCVRYRKRLVFPSTSEVYGMCDDSEFDEDESPLVLGPIRMQRWIYSCSKQLLDRVIWAYGEKAGLRFTIFRPFNWIGPKLDRIDSPKEGSSRVVTQFIINLFRAEPIKLVDGGAQRRCFTYIDDGIDCLMRILADTTGATAGQIFNVGNPRNECSVRELAYQLRDLYQKRLGKDHHGKISDIEVTGANDYYGKGYQDIVHRKPSIERARKLLGWEPRFDLRQSLDLTLSYFLEEQRARDRRRVEKVDPASTAAAGERQAEA
ncbi:MAG: bifunctional UDP-4-keto-pentose/UDP-xylose synthase [Planctomycetota bacterium]